MLIASQKQVKEKALNFDQSAFKVVKTVKGPVVSAGDGPSESNKQESEFKVYDFNYYNDEIDVLEGWFMGELSFGEFKMKRELIETDDRLCSIQWNQKASMYFTRMVSTKFNDSDRVATIALVHGFAENQSISFFEAAMMYAINGFEVVMIDLRAHGYSSGARGVNWTVHDNHESFIAMFKQIRTDKPFFVHCHSMGCMAFQSFLVRNPSLNLAGVIYGAPFFGMPVTADMDLPNNQILAQILSSKDFDILGVNPTLPVHLLCREPMYFRKMLGNDNTASS